MKITLFLPSVDALMASETIQIATDGLKHSCVSAYFTQLLRCSLEHKQVLSDLLSWTNNSGSTQSATQ